MEYTIVRTPSKSGKRTLFYPTINGKRLTRTNFARKYDARNLVKAAVAKYGVDKLQEMFA